MERLPAPVMGFFGRVLATVVTVVVGVGLLMFSIVVFAVIFAVGLGFWAYLWWKTRELRQALREQVAQAARNPETTTRTTTNPSATVIEGEYVRLDDAGRELPRQDQ